jgi:hypothetical protein
VLQFSQLSKYDPELVVSGEHIYDVGTTTFSEQGDAVEYNKNTGKFSITDPGLYELSVSMTAFLEATPDWLSVMLRSPVLASEPILKSEVKFPDKISTIGAVYVPLCARGIYEFTQPTEITVWFDKTTPAAAYVANTYIFIRKLD